MTELAYKDIHGQDWVFAPLRANQAMSTAAADYAKKQVGISGGGGEDFKALAWDICAGHREMLKASLEFSPGADLLERAARGLCRHRVEQNLHHDGKSATVEQMQVYIDAGWQSFIEEARYALGGIFGAMPARA